MTKRPLVLRVMYPFVRGTAAFSVLWFLFHEHCVWRAVVALAAYYVITWLDHDTARMERGERSAWDPRGPGPL